MRRSRILGARIAELGLGLGFSKLRFKVILVAAELACVVDGFWFSRKLAEISQGKLEFRCSDLDGACPIASHARPAARSLKEVRASTQRRVHWKGELCTGSLIGTYDLRS